jgi:hypothetical protein
MLRSIGTGNLNGFAGYTLGPHSVTAGFDNTRGPPESGDDSAPIRLQPKVHFDIGECVERGQFTRRQKRPFLFLLPPLYFTGRCMDYHERHRI